MKASWIWLIIGAVFGGVWYLRSRKPAAEKSDGVPEGTVIGQIGSRIENPEALSEFAQSLSTSSQPRVLSVQARGSNWLRYVWTDGRVTITDGSGNVLSDTPFIPSP